MSADLDDFLAESGAAAWSWGEVDGCMFLADWAMANGYGDLLALYRGAYSDEAGCLAIIVKRGGLFPILSDGCARAGLPKIDAPARGAIAVIGSFRVPARQWGAIWDGDRWLVKATDGFRPLVAPALGMWSI